MIVNLQETEVDLHAELVIHEKVDMVMADLAARLQLVRTGCPPAAGLQRPLLACPLDAACCLWCG